MDLGLLDVVEVHVGEHERPLLRHVPSVELGDSAGEENLLALGSVQLGDDLLAFSTLLFVFEGGFCFRFHFICGFKLISIIIL